MKESKLYELMDDSSVSCGIVETDATEEVIEEAWKRVHNGELTDIDNEAIGQYHAWDMSYCDWVIAILIHSGYNAGRLFTTEIYS